jgi:hypothetical protein
VLGVGYQGHDLFVIGRISLYLLGINKEGVLSFFGVKEPSSQGSFLVGYGARAAKTHLSFGSRFNLAGLGPVLLVDHSFGPVSMRLEGSYLVSIWRGIERVPSLLTVGLTVGGPAP